MSPTKKRSPIAKRRWREILTAARAGALSVHDLSGYETKQINAHSNLQRAFARAVGRGFARTDT